MNYSFTRIDYWRKYWSVILKEKLGLRVFENELLRANILN
jgi:hypothetical protein